MKQQESQRFSDNLRVIFLFKHLTIPFSSMHYWRFGHDGKWWPMDPSAGCAVSACDESVVGQSGEFRFENSLFMLCSGAPFVYCVKAHSDSGIFFRFIVHSEHVWNEIRVGASEPVGDGQNARQESRKRKA